MSQDTEPTPTTAYRLVVLGDGSVRTIPLVGSRWIVGRAPECSIPLRDPTVSRRHLSLERRGETFRFQDLGGSNPLLLDGRPIHQGVLEVGQTLLVGLTRLSLERRHRGTVVVPQENSTVMLSREVIDEELPSTATSNSYLGMARRILERIEWTFADLGVLEDVAEPLLELGLNLTGRRRGVLGRFNSQGAFECLASLDAFGIGQDLYVPEQVLDEARRLGRTNLLTMQEQGKPVNRLVIPFGSGPDGVVVLEEPQPDAASGQELLRLGRAFGTVAWHRLQEAAERLRLREEVQRLRFHGTTAHNALLASSRLQGVRQQLRELANQDGPVVLIGEDGTEREDLARYLHIEGNRARQPFVAILLANLPDFRREKELFGDGRGMADAVSRARGGTLFLDAIDRLPLDQQERLAACFQSIPPAESSDQAPAPRLIAATDEAIDAGDGSWHPKLLALLESPPLAIPPLRTDARDVLALAELFLSEMGSTPDGSPRLLSERTKRLLVGHPWPGNVRELRQVLELAAARAGNQPIAPRHLPEAFAEPGEAPGPSSGVLIPTLEDVEQRHIRDVLQRVGGNRARAAQVLGIAASTLYEKLRRYAIDA